MIRYLHIVRDHHARDRLFQRLAKFIVILAMVLPLVAAACACSKTCPGIPPIPAADR